MVKASDDAEENWYFKRLRARARVSDILCPHCDGILAKLREELAETVGYQYTCTTCGRGWHVSQENEGERWTALFDAGGHVYRREKNVFKDITPMEKWRQDSF